jgi:hypothetical protein
MGQPLPSKPPNALSPLTERALEVDRVADGLVRFLAPCAMPAGPVLVDGRGGTDWVVVDARLDPHLAAGNLSIPREARRDLERIAASGARFDALLIGHELPAGTVAALEMKTRAELAQPQSGVLAPKVASKLEGLIGAPVPDRIAQKVVSTTRQVLSTFKGGMAVAASTAAGLLDAGLDPVVFGVVAAHREPRAGERVALFYLTHWT